MMHRRYVAFDTETHRVQPGLLAPPLVCASAAIREGGEVVGQLLDRVSARAAFRRLLDSDCVIVGANIAYDMLVMAVDAAKSGEDLLPSIFAAYDAGRVFDVQVALALEAIAGGYLGRYPDGSQLRDEEGKPVNRYSLYNCVKIILGRDTAKVNDRWRFSYSLLEDVPIEEWSFEARQYPVDDAVNTLEVALAQVGVRPRADGVTRDSPNLWDLTVQVRAAWAMHLGAAWGLTVDPATIEDLASRVSEERRDGALRLTKLGFYRPDGSRDTGAVRWRTAAAYGATVTCTTCAGEGRIFKLGKQGQHLKSGSKGCEDCSATGFDLTNVALPRTETGQVSTGRDSLYESGDEDLMSLAEYLKEAKIEETYLPFLRTGVGEDGRAIPLCLRPNVLVDTGRASYGDVIDQLPRKGGVRECFVARPGRLLFSVDWSGIELVAHAQSCLWLLGKSRLAEVINAGGASAVHAHLAARMVGVAPEKFVAELKSNAFYKAARQAAKALNFGLTGGMGEAKLVLQQRVQGPDTTCDGGPVEVSDGKLGYKGLRFCVLVGGARSCGTTKVTEWKSRPIPPTCAACLEVAKDLRQKWLDQWPENVAYFEYVSRIVRRAEEVGAMPTVVQHVSGRVRGGVTFTSAANSFFQGLTADGMKRAVYRVSREMYLARPGDALYGARLIKSAHDEFIGEVPESTAHEGASRVSEIMVSTMREVCPEVANEAPPALMRRWYKGAEAVYQDGRLVPWEP